MSTLLIDRPETDEARFHTPDAPFCTDEAPYFGIDIPFMRYLGLQAEHVADGYARARLPASGNLVNSRQDTHGGTMMSVLDFIMSAAARGHDPLGLGVVTMEMSTHFLEVARGELVFEGRMIRRGRSTAFCEGEVTDSKGSKVCIARATFRLLDLNR